MPRYRYMCHTCLNEFMVHHSWKEEQKQCIHCEASDISKIITNSFITKVKKDSKERVGEKTKEYIESNREVLKELQEEAKKEVYE